MKRAALCTLTLLLALGIAVVGAAGQATKDMKSPAAKKPGKTLSASGKVTAVAADSVSIMKGTETMKFTVDAATKVSAKGAGTKAKAGPVTVTDLVHEGDMVTVSYHDMGGGMLHAAQVRVSGGAAKKK